jgi:spoIIIJ-associated protein
MDMKRIEAPTLEEAYRKASEAFSCSITEINYQIVQYPTGGVMGLFKKPAIIVAVRKVASTPAPAPTPQEEQEKIIEEKPTVEETQPTTSKEPEKVAEVEELRERISKKDDKVLDSFFDKSKDNSFRKFDDDRDTPQNRAISLEIERSIKKLIDKSCFNIDTIEVDVFNKIAHIFIDGEDAALLIGKEGYRYNALSYMLFNWINARYNLYIKLEIAEFIQSQEEMIVNYLKPIIEHVEKNGRGKTKPLDGILVQIALEQLRARFPNKYVAIKTAKDSRKFIIINNFNSSRK